MINNNLNTPLSTTSYSTLKKIEGTLKPTVDKVNEVSQPKKPIYQNTVTNQKDVTIDLTQFLDPEERPQKFINTDI